MDVGKSVEFCRFHASVLGAYKLVGVVKQCPPRFVANDVGSHIGGHSNPLVPYLIISSISVWDVSV